MRAERVVDHPIVHAGVDPSIGTNIQGPSVIHAPPWAQDPLGAYYLYFADHKGSFIRLAYADDIAGPWRVHTPGALHLPDSCFPTEPPAATEEELEFLRVVYTEALGDAIPVETLVVDATTPHIASPDVHVDTDRHRVVMYFHGLDSFGVQVTRAAVSEDGISFTAAPEVLGRPYFRGFAYQGMTYALSMPGHFSRSSEPLASFEEGPQLFANDMRHSAVWCHDNVLDVFWTRVGDAPESILWSQVELGGPWTEWTVGPERLILRPELAWEGATEVIEPSRRGAVNERVNQLRDPAVFHDGDRLYLFYAGGGESAIGVAELVS